VQVLFERRGGGHIRPEGEERLLDRIQVLHLGLLLERRDDDGVVDGEEHHQGGEEEHRRDDRGDGAFVHSLHLPGEEDRARCDEGHFLAAGDIVLHGDTAPYVEDLFFGREVEVFFVIEQVTRRAAVLADPFVLRS